MMNPSRYFLLFVSLLVVSMGQFSCKRQQLRKSEVLAGKPAATPDSVAANTPPPAREEKKLVLKPNEVAFDYLKIKSKVDFSSPTISQSFPATIQVKKDSLIWVSVSVGLEAARGIIRPDSAIFLDRINRNVYRFSMADLSKLLGFELSFGLVQSILIGNMPIPIRPNDDISLSSGFYTVKQSVGKLTVENAIDALTKRLHRIAATQQERETRLSITYSDFRQLPETTAPHQVQAVVQSAKNAEDKLTEVVIEHTKFDFLDRNLRFPFVIPKGYKEVKVLPKN